MNGGSLNEHPRGVLSVRRALSNAPWAVVLVAVLVATSTSGAATASVRQPAPSPMANPERGAGSDVGTLAGTGSPAQLNGVPQRLGPVASPPAATPLEPFAMDLFEVGDFVPQHTFEWCVAASIQMAWNMVHPDIRSSRDDQLLLWEQARDRSNNPYRGADPGGWTDLLNEIGLGPYELVSIPDYDEALKVAAGAMRDTGRPVGLVMWRGRHAWVMSGFESLGDPSSSADFEVTAIRVVDPLYPYGSGTWGPSPEPNQLLTREELAKQFVFREQRRWSSHIPAGFLLVLPVKLVAAGVRYVTGGPGSPQHFVRFRAL